jgi:two-component system, cell cycle sensor histidine kinase and response regulator CckA
MDIPEQKKTDNPQWESGEQYRLVVESLNEGIVIAQEGMLQFVNQKFAEITGYTKEELTSKLFTEFIHPDDRVMVLERHLKRLSGEMGTTHLYHFRIIDKSGKVKWMQINGALSSWKGRPATINFLTDITEQKKSLEQLRETKKHLQALYDASPDMIFVHDKDGRIIDVNDNMLRNYGYASVGELQNLLPSDLSADGYTTEMTMSKVRLAFEGKHPDFEWMAKRKNGETFPVDVRLRRLDLLNNGGTVEPGVLAIVRDITERKKAETSFAHYTSSLKRLLDVSQAITVTTDLNKLYRSVISTAQDLLSLDFSTLMILTKDKKQLIIKDTLGFPEAMINTFRLVEGQGLSSYVIQNALPGVVTDFTTETRFDVPPVISEKGINSAVCVLMMFEGDILGVLIGHTLMQRTFTDEEISLYQNIANQAAVAIQNSLHLSALMESEEKYRKLVESANDAIFIADAETGIIIEANERAGRLLGMPPGEIVGMHQSQLHPTDETMRNRERFQGHVERGRIDGEEFLVCTRSGEIIPVEISASTTEVGGRKIIQGIFRDIRERKQAEKEQQKLISIIENTSDFIGMATLGGTIFYINAAGRALVGLGSIQEARQRELYDFVVEEDRRNLQEIMALIVQRRGWKGELRFRHFSKNRSVPVELNIFLILDEETGQPVAVAAIATDLTDRKQMEDELLKAQKLESLGVLAGGIAHDFNNLLTAIMGNIGLSMMHLDSEGDVIAWLKEAENATVRAKDLTQQLLTFSRGGLPVKAIISIGPVIEEAARFALRGAQVRCELSLPVDLWPVEADTGQISQVVNNLLINANQAMPAGGIVSIVGENVNIGEQTALPLQPGPYVSITVKDTGIGIAKEFLPKIFDPYFTTKQTGSGLGLASSYSIVKKHGGYIAVESRLGAGTTFTLYLRAAPGNYEKQQAGESQPKTGKGNILVMDDDAAIRTVSTSMLKLLGYHAIAVTSGEEALEAYLNANVSGSPYDAVITDLTVPGGMGGEELIKELLVVDPKAKVIVSSGYSNDPIMANYQEYGFSGVLVKPYKSTDMAKVLSTVLLESRQAP